MRTPVFKLPEDILSKTIADIGEIPPAKLDGFCEKLETLYSLAIVYQAFTPRQVRSDINGAIADLKRVTERMAESFRYHSWFIETPLRLSAIDQWMTAKQSSDSNTADLAVPSQIVSQIEESLELIVTATKHLQTLASTFDRISDSGDDLFTWIGECRNDHHAQVRAELSTYLMKGGTVKPDTLIMRNVALLHQYLFDHALSIPSNESSVNYQQKLAELNIQSSSSAASQSAKLPRYTGSGLRFAVAIIDNLGLQGCFVAINEDDDLGFSSRVTDEQPMSAMERKEFSRAQALRGRSVDSVTLENRIGDTWKNETKRRRNTPGRKGRQSLEAR